MPRPFLRAGRIVVDARHRFPVVPASDDVSRVTGDAAEG